MKKFSLFILALLCLCANVAWAVDVSSFGSDPLNYYYLKNTEHNNQYVQVLSSAIKNQWYKTVASPSEATSFSIDKYNYSTQTWPTAFSFVDGGTTYWLGEDDGNTQKNGSYFAWTAENKDNVKFELKHHSDHDRRLNDNGTTLEVPRTGESKDWIYWAVEAKSTNNETTYYLYNKGQQAFLSNNGGKAAVTTNSAQAAKIVINKFSVSPIQFYGTSNYLYQAAGNSSSSTTALDFAIYAGNGGFYLYNENGSEGGFFGIGSGTNKRYLRASSNNGDCDYPKDEVGNNSTWYFISEDDFTLLSAIISYENAVAAAPSPSDYTYLTTELADALTTAKGYTFTKSSSVSNVNAAITELSNAVAAADEYMFINGKELVETNCLNGWTEVTESMPGTPSNYYFAIVSAQTRKALMAGKKSDNQELSYQNISDPTSDLYKTWMIEQSTNGSYSGAFVFRSLANVDEITTATGSDPWNLLVSSTSANGTFNINDNEEAAHYLIFDKGVWKIRNGRISSPLYYWGAWHNANYVDGERIAGNAGGNTNESASFYIYSIPKADYIAKYIANRQTDLNFAVRNRGFLYNGNGSVSPYWEGTGSDKSAAFAPQTGSGSGNNSFDNGSTFAEMWVGENTAMSAGNIRQTVSLPAGTYTLSADVVSSNITSYLYASYGGVSPISVECSGISTKTTKTITFVVSSKQDVTIGYRHEGCSATSGSKWVAIDNVTLTYVGAYVAPSGNNNSDWICPQGTCASYLETGATETYGGNTTNFPVGKVIYQHRTGLPNGRYHVRFYAVANYADWGEGVNYGTGIAQVYSQAETIDIEVHKQKACTPTEHPYEFDVSVTDGTLEFGIKNIAEGGNWYVAKLDAITYIAPFTVTTNANGWASFCPSYDVAVPEGIKIYSGTYHSNATNSWLSLNEQSVTSIAAGDGVLLSGEPSTNYIFEWTSSATKIAGNDLTGSTERIDNPAKSSSSSVYVLGTREGETALYKYTGDKIPANKAYLELPGGSSAPSIRIVASPEISTSIENIESENIGTLDWTQPVYNVMGLQVSKGATGVLIQNGQKFYVW